MQIPSWRLALTASALVILGAAGGGLVSAAASPSGAVDRTAAGSNRATDAAATLDDIVLAVDPGASAPSLPDRAAGLRDRLGIKPGALRQRLVHGTITVVGRDGKLVTLQLDHGTISAKGDGTLTIAEQGGGSVTIATTDATRVRKAKAPATLADLAIGDEVFAASQLDGGTATARRIVVPPAAPAEPAATAPGT